MTTYFIHTTFPLDTWDEDLAAVVHKEFTGNQLAIIPNANDTECLLKVNTDVSLSAVAAGLTFTPIAIYTDIDAVRTMISTAPWVKAPLI